MAGVKTAVRGGSLVTDLGRPRNGFSLVKKPGLLGSSAVGATTGGGTPSTVVGAGSVIVRGVGVLTNGSAGAILGGGSVVKATIVTGKTAGVVTAFATAATVFVFSGGGTLVLVTAV